MKQMDYGSVRNRKALRVREGSFAVRGLDGLRGAMGANPSKILCR